jgi:hypothetical protein
LHPPSTLSTYTQITQLKLSAVVNPAPKLFPYRELRIVKMPELASLENGQRVKIADAVICCGQKRKADGEPGKNVLTVTTRWPKC